MYRCSLAFLVSCAVTFGAGAADDAVLREAKSLIDAGKAHQAYALLKPLEATEAGNSAYDVLLGQAALDSGHSTEAIFALQRAVDMDPDNGPARAELGRALLVVNETDAAKRELETVQQQNPPDDVRRALEGYLASINQYHGAYRTTFAPYVQTGLGFDTNVNSATDRTQVAAPGLGGLVFDLTSDSQELDSPVWEIGAGFTFSSPLETDLRIVGGIDFEYRVTPRDSDFTTTNANGHTGLQLTRGADQYSAIAQGEKYFVDGTGTTKSDRELGGAVVQWRHSLNVHTQFSVFGQASLIRFPEQRVRNVNRYAGGVGVAHALPQMPGSPVLFASAFGGTEDSQNDRVGTLGTSGKHFDRDFYGVRAGGQRLCGSHGTLFASATYQASDYNAPDPIFAEIRDDDFFDITAGYRYQYDRNWSLTPHVSYINNDSNITVSNYDRVEFMVILRNDF